MESQVKDTLRGLPNEQGLPPSVPDTKCADPLILVPWARATWVVTI